MRTLCDVCEAAPARLFCAADEAALCFKCDEKVHGCNKLASRHVRVELAEARAVPRCDICENAPAFFFCGIDGTSLCLQCDMDVHIGGKKTHERYLLMGQRVEIPSTKVVVEVAVNKTPEAAKDAPKQPGNEHHHHHHHYHHHHHHHDYGQGEDGKRQAPGTIAKSSDWNNSDAPAVAITMGDDDLVSYPDVQVGRMIDLNSKPSFLHSQSLLTKNKEAGERMSRDDDCIGVVPQMSAQDDIELSSGC